MCYYRCGVLLFRMPCIIVIFMQESTICSKCGLTVDRILSLECTHNLCVRCSARQITRLQKRNKLG
jgi:hypothetical protein